MGRGLARAGVRGCGTSQPQGEAASWECSNSGACTALSSSPQTPTPPSSCALLSVPAPRAAAQYGTTRSDDTSDHPQHHVSNGTG